MVTTIPCPVRSTRSSGRPVGTPFPFRLLMLYVCAIRPRRSLGRATGRNDSTVCGWRGSITIGACGARSGRVTADSLGARAGVDAVSDSVASHECYDTSTSSICCLCAWTCVWPSILVRREPLVQSFEEREDDAVPERDERGRAHVDLRSTRLQ